MSKFRLIFIVLLTVWFIGCNGNNVKNPQNTPVADNTPTVETPSIGESNTTEETNTTHIPLKIACVGDSLTQGYGYDGAENESYPEQLKPLINNTEVEVKNFGIFNKTAMHSASANDPYIHTTEYNDSKDFAPDTVVIMFGTNDVKSVNWDKNESFITEYTALIQSYIDLPSKPKVYVCLPTPSHKDNFTITDSKIKDELIPKIKEIAKKLNLETIDLHTPFIDKSSSFIEDGLHPNAIGAKEIAEIIHERIY
ncbi:MAG: GDSL-type esterase/lipase family protein [Sulfurovum sp.]|nr:GDSL-type esterase/lipase family protein [Sulfurovum sp.]